MNKDGGRQMLQEQTAADRSTIVGRLMHVRQSDFIKIINFLNLNFKDKTAETESFAIVPNGQNTVFTPFQWNWMV